MAIAESQLQTWSHQGAIQTSSATYNSVKTTLEASGSLIRGRAVEVFLQGSYGNDTNIYGDSDVDIVVQLHEPWYRNISHLTSQETVLYEASVINATYRWENFYNDVVETLRQHYGRHLVDTAGKAIKVLPGSGRLGADVVAALDHRVYFSFQNHAVNSKIVGIQFCIPAEEDRIVINYPTQQKANNKKKHQATSEWYKPTVRIFKNMRNYLIEQRVISEDTAPSYFVEGLIYNVPNNCFGSSYQLTVQETLRWLINDAVFSQFRCQNERLLLFGSSPEQWSEPNAQRFVMSCVDFWNAS